MHENDADVDIIEPVVFVHDPYPLKWHADL